MAFHSPRLIRDVGITLAVPETANKGSNFPEFYWKYNLYYTVTSILQVNKQSEPSLI